MVEQAGMSDEGVEAATGKGWPEWRQWIEANGGEKLSHAEIARLLNANGVPGWWSQMVTVGYERLTGKRAMGQRCDGAFSASASRTVDGSMDDALARWLAVVDGMIEFGDAFAETEPRQSRSENGVTGKSISMTDPRSASPSATRQAARRLSAWATKSSPMPMPAIAPRLSGNLC